MSKTAPKNKPQFIYKSPPSAVVTDSVLDYSVLCPVCGKRTMDVSILPERLVVLQYKCPHCRNLVQTPLISK